MNDGFAASVNSDEISARIQRYMEMVREHDATPWPCLTLNEVEEFESRYKVTLPEEYRKFIMEGANGFTEPMMLVRLGHHDCRLPKGDKFRDAWDKIIDKSLAKLAEPFPFDETIVWEGRVENEVEAILDLTWQGRLMLRDLGCSMIEYLIVTGPKRGTVWEICDVGMYQSHNSFLDWLEGRPTENDDESTD